MIIPKSAEKWHRAMKRTKVGKKVLENIIREENVPRNVRKKFFDKLGKTFIVGTCPLNHMEKVLITVTETALSGHKANVGSMELLIRFSRLARLPEQPIFKRAGISFRRLLKNPGLINRLTKLHLGNDRDIVWAALEDPVESDIRSGMNIQKILDKLGLTDKFIESWYQAVYNKSDFGSPCLVPTVLDAGTNYRFRPVGKNAPHGITFPCSGVGSGYPECVHEKCVIDQPGIKVYIF